MSRLISYFQLYNNLRRTASNGLMSLLNHQQLEELAFKHFSCVNKETGQIGYQCPYTGIEFYDYEDIILEHIIPVSSMGGTVLFNCIPAYKGVNGPSEKGANHLLDWWKNKGKQYYKPERLDKLLSYMFDAYDIVFANHTIEEIENSYEDIDLDENIFSEYYDTEQNNDNPEDIKELSKEDEELKKQAKKTGVISYLGFINDCLRELKDNNYDTTKYEEKLKEYEKYGYFENIERYTLFQNTIKDIVENMLSDKKTGLLTYTINFNISKLMDSMKDCETKEDIRNELEKRLNNIERILQENNLSMMEYFKSLRDIHDIDILYKNIDNIISNELQVFLKNVKLGIDTKIEIFIKMLNQGNNEILKRRNNLTLDGYPSIKLSQFWSTYKDKIQHFLFETLKDDTSYDVARKTILDKYEVHSYEELINKQNLTLDEMIKIYIGMLNTGNSEILKQGNNLTLDGYPSIKLTHFWNTHKDKITIILFEILKDDLKYDIARKIILDKYGVHSYEKLINKQNLTTDEMINIYIDMLNKGKIEILKTGNNFSLDGYSSIKLTHFWDSHKNKIQPLLFETLKDDTTYDVARKTILDKYEVHTYEELIDKQKNRQEKFELSLDTKIDIFINMLNQGNVELLTRGNDFTLDGYPSIKLTYFWQTYRDKIQPFLFETLKDDTSYEVARKIILNKYEVHTYEELINKQKNRHETYDIPLDIKIDIFVKMLNTGNSEILMQNNNLTLDGYPSIKFTYFWGNYKDKIQHFLFETLKDDTSYDVARKTILDKYEVHSYEELINKQNLTPDEMIKIYIGMLNQGKIEILKTGNNLTLDGYPFVNLAQFWSGYQDKILSMLFETLKDDTSYDVARKTILDKYEVDSYKELEFSKKENLHLRIACFIEMLNKGNKEILKSTNKEFFNGYQNIPIKFFWHQGKNREIIIQTLFNKLKDNSSYDTARRLILENLKVKSIEEYYEKIEIESKKMKDNKKMKKQLEKTIKLVDETYQLLNNEEHRKRA